jgi:chemotaxis protein MotB
MYQRSVIKAPVGIEATSWKQDDRNYSYKGYEFRYGERELVQAIVQQKMNTMKNGSNAFDANAGLLSFTGQRIDYATLLRERIELTLSDEEKVGASKTFFTKVKEELQFIPAQLKVLEYWQEKAVFEQDRQLVRGRDQIATHMAQLAAATEHAESLSQQRDALTSELNAALEKQRVVHNQIDDLSKQLTQATGQGQSVAEDYHQAREQLALQQARSQSATETINELEARMAKEKVATDNLQSLQSLSHEKKSLVSRLEDGTTVIKLPESIMFNSDSATIGKAGRHTLTLLADALNSFPDHLISIQGHSDSRSIAPALQSLYPTNWELSASRAVSAGRVLRETGIDSSRMQAVGFADTRPLVKEIDAGSRQKNRRIEVLLYPSQFKIKDY